MAEEPRRSGRATKGQHTKTASTSPAPQPKPAKRGSKPKTAKKTRSAQADPTEEEEDENVDETIRCICGNDDPEDKRTFISCDTCEVWQHNVCMGMHDEQDELPDHYFCEECQPSDHAETLNALASGEKIWETRNRIHQNEKKASSKRKSKTGPSGWLKKDVPLATEPEAPVDDAEDVPGSKRKRGDKAEPALEPEVKEEPEERSARGSRQDKRRKANTNGGAVDADAETALVNIDKLPTDRQKVAAALSKIIFEDIESRVKKDGFRVPDGHTAKSLGEYHAARIEYALKMNHEGPQNPPYLHQFRTLNANLKKNKVLVTRLLDGNLSADELSTMESKDLASEELQKQNALLKEQADRQAVAIQDEGPRYRRTHKGDELIEDENAMLAEGTKTVAAQPVRERTSVIEEEQQGSLDSPTESHKRSTSRPQLDLEPKRSSSQQFEIGDIWAKTAQSPTSATAPLRPMQVPPRRRSSIKPDDQAPSSAQGTKEDADVDRLLQDEDDETYSPAEYADGTSLGPVVWRGKLIQSADGVTSTVNARFVAGRDLTDTVSWSDLLPAQLTIDGRLQIESAELYLRSLQYSHSTDVSVLMLTPNDNSEAFEQVFQYFKSRQRYAVVNKDRPQMVRDLYLIPMEQGEAIPGHVDLLMFNQLGDVLKEKCLLATFVVSRTPDAPSADAAAITTPADQNSAVPAANGQQTSLPQHMRPATGPAGSPLNANPATFSPPTGGDSMAGYLPQAYPAGYPVASPNPLVSEVLGSLQFAPTAQRVLLSDQNLSREKMLHLRKVLEEYPAARTDIEVLAAMLGR